MSIMNSSKKVLPLTQQVYRQVARKSSSDAYPVRPSYKKFLERRAKLEIPDDTPIHIKNGFGDKILTQITWGLAIVGTGMALETFYSVATGKKA